ncbi:hypothetical protein LJB42_004620 [Komagataella kurtzmanii]|nr:hypothetical protein LJB42_004620 [Komagataella kurtzmanii]
MAYSVSKTLFDPEGRFFGYSVDRRSRNEIIICEVSSGQVVSRFQLDMQDEILAFTWVTQKQSKASVKRASKRTTNGEVVQANGGAIPLKNLAVMLKNGAILILSPYHNDISNKIVNESEIKCLSSYSDSNGIFYGYDKELKAIKLFNATENRSVSTLEFSVDKNIDLIQVLKNNTLLLASASIYLVSPNDSIDYIRLPVPRGHGTRIVSLVQSIRNPDIIVTARINDTTLCVHSLHKKGTVTTVDTLLTVVSIHNFELDDNEYLATLNDNGVIQICQLPTGKGQTITFSQIRTDSKVPLTGFYVKDGVITVSWFQDMHPRFVKFPCRDSDYIIETEENSSESQEEDDDKDEDEVTNILESEKEEMIDSNNIVETAEELYDLISNNIEDESKVISICASNNSNVGETVKNLNKSKASRLFIILVQYFTSNVVHSSSLKLWIKWIIVTHGRILIESPETVQLLQLLSSILDEEKKVLPTMLSLQGKLTLLKAQLSLRNEIASISLEDEEKNVNSTTVYTVADENLTYDNGETDDFANVEE